MMNDDMCMLVLWQMLVVLATAARILAVKASTSIHLAGLPCQPTCLISLPALPSFLPCQPSCLVSLPALSAFLPCQPSCLVSLPALSAHLSCQPSCHVSLPALSAFLPCQPSCLVSQPVLFCARSQRLFLSKQIFCQLICHDLFTFLRYLWAPSCIYASLMQLFSTMQS